MSGIELAGIILAAFPLVISAIEHKDVGFEPLNAMIFKKKRKGVMQQTFDENSMLFRHCCEKMLSIAEIENIADMMAKDDSDRIRALWVDPSLEPRLRSAFGQHSFSVIQSRLVEIYQLIRKFREYLEAGRIKQAYKSISQGKHIEDLGKAIVALRTVLEGESLSVIIGTAGTAWQQEIEKMKITRTHILDIYACVEASWGCACQKDHTVNFQCRDVKDDHISIVLAPSSSRPVPKVARVPWVLQPFQLSTCDKTQSTVSTQTTTTLCKSLENRAGIKELLSPPNSQKYRHSIRTPARLPDPKAMISLAESLKSAQAFKQAVGMRRGPRSLMKTPRDRIAIGARLLVTVLQQHSVPWLQPNWTTNDVFLRSGEGCSLQPYFEAPFTTINTGTATCPSPKPFKPLFSRNATLYHLGVALIEIAMNDTIENLTTDEDRAAASQDPTMARAVAAYRLSEELADHLIPLEYRNATRYCLKGEFGIEIKGKELSDDDLFSTVYRKAAKPLMELVSRDCY